jgi:hypothetical protein
MFYDWKLSDAPTASFESEGSVDLDTLKSLLMFIRDVQNADASSDLFLPLNNRAKKTAPTNLPHDIPHEAGREVALLKLKVLAEAWRKECESIYGAGTVDHHVSSVRFGCRREIESSQKCTRSKMNIASLLNDV